MADSQHLADSEHESERDEIPAKATSVAHQADQVTPAELPPEELPPENGLFRVVLFASAAFILTILIMSVASFVESDSPIPQFFNDHGLTVISLEVAVILVVGFFAMVVDRKQTAIWQYEQLERKALSESANQEKPGSQQSQPDGSDIQDAAALTSGQKGHSSDNMA